MSQNTKDSNGGKAHPVKNTGSSSKSSDKGVADRNPASPAGSHNRGEKKTTP